MTTSVGGSVQLCVTLYRGKGEDTSESEIILDSNTSVNELREHVNKIASPWACSAILQAGRRCEEGEKARDLAAGEHKIVAFLKAPKAKLKQADQSASNTAASSVQSQAPTKKSKPAKETAEMEEEFDARVMSRDCKRVLEGFRVLNQLVELHSNNWAKSTVARACAFGRQNGGALCMDTLQQMVHLCPGLFVIKPDVGQDARSVDLATVELLVPECDDQAHEQATFEQGEAGRKRKRLGGWNRQKPMRRQIRDSMARIETMTEALWEHMDTQHNEFLNKEGHVWPAEARMPASEQQHTCGQPNSSFNGTSATCACAGVHSDEEHIPEVPPPPSAPTKTWHHLKWHPRFDPESVAPVPKADILAHAHSEQGGEEDWGRLRCSGSQDLSAEEFIEHVLSLSEKNANCVVHVHKCPIRVAKIQVLRHTLSDKVKGMMRESGVPHDNLYCHQANAIDACLDGHNVVVTTATASGKSLCFNIPVLNSIIDPDGHGLDAVTGLKALYLYPTKALAQDQLRAFRRLSSLWLSDKSSAVFDGDTPKSERAHIMRDASVILTNPDMLHVTLLPNHKKYSNLLACLKYVIVDEAHMYHGAFGMHTGMVVRRLRRICKLYGASPQWICCSATIGAPREHISLITALPQESLVVVSEDGSPCGAKNFVLWNPPLKPELPKRRPHSHSGAHDAHASDHAAHTSNHVHGDEWGTASWFERDDLDNQRRYSSISEVAFLLAELVRHNVRTIAFCTTRKLSELVLQYAHDSLQQSGHSSLCDKVKSYRGGYTPEQRRSVEADLFGDVLRGVAATNALELGVDVGTMDATVHLGFQRSIASLWQQAGRAGRRNKTSLSIYVAWDSPLDQWLLSEPKRLFEMSLESLALNMENNDILHPHLLCAAAELPLQAHGDPELWGKECFHREVSRLVSDGHPVLGCLQPFGAGGVGGDSSAAQSWNFCGGKTLFQDVSLRTIEQERWQIVCKMPGGQEHLMEEVEETMAFYQVYEGAVYMNTGRKYIVERLDTEKKIAYTGAPVHVDYYTAVRDKGRIRTEAPQLLVSNDDEKDMSEKGKRRLVCKPHFGDATVEKDFVGYRKHQKITGKFIESVDLVIPSISYHTKATWVSVPEHVQIRVKEIYRGHKVAWEEFLRAGLHAACHAITNVLPLFAKCSASDVITHCEHAAAKRYEMRRLIMADRCKGGNGLSRKAYDVWVDLVDAALSVVKNCKCTSPQGCPSCVYMLSCPEHNHMLDKKSAIVILEGMVIGVEEERKEEAGAGGMDLNEMVYRRQRTLY